MHPSATLPEAWNGCPRCRGIDAHLPWNTQVTRERYASLGMTRLVSSGVGSHEIRFDARHSIFDAYEKTLSTVRVASALPDLGALSMEIDVAEKVEGRNTRLWGFETSLALEIFGKRTVLTDEYNREGGSDCFGTPREERVISTGIERDVNARLGIGVGVSQRFSTVDLYNESFVFLGFQLRGWSPRKCLSRSAGDGGFECMPVGSETQSQFGRWAQGRSGCLKIDPVSDRKNGASVRARAFSSIGFGCPDNISKRHEESRNLIGARAFHDAVGDLSL